MKRFESIIRPPERGLFEDPERARQWLGTPNGRAYMDQKALHAGHALHGTPQAILKITSYSGGVTAVSKHLNYIANKCEYGLEDEQGLNVLGQNDIRDLIDEWRVDFSRERPLQEEKLKLVFDARGRDKQQIYNQVKDFARERYGDYSQRVDVGRTKNTGHQISLTVHQDGPVRLYQAELQKAVQSAFPDLPLRLEVVKNRKTRDTLNLTLSAPIGTAAEKINASARAFAKAQFGEAGHPYVFALHTDRDHPHVHLSVKMVNDDGQKLDPKKRDLEQWRGHFAALCREQGIAVIASRRSERGMGRKGERQAIRQMKARGETPRVERDARRDILQALKGGQLDQSWELLVRGKRELERQELQIIAGALRAQARELATAKDKAAAIAKAAIVEKWARALPEPQTRREERQAELQADYKAHKAAQQTHEQGERGRDRQDRSQEYGED